MDVILLRYPPSGPQDLPAPLALVTDDTQMTLAMGEALLQAAQPYTVKTLEDPLRDAFIAWNESPENNRAPGITCKQACDYLACGLPWYKATIASSKGCGANMRVAPVGLLPLWGEWFDGYHSCSHCTISGCSDTWTPDRAGRR